MRKRSGGFTLIEVALFLAVTGLLFLGVMGGVQASLDQQRNDDSVYDFMSFLRGIYSKVENVQNYKGGGRSGQVVYGKLVTFGEQNDLAGVQGKNLNGDGRYKSVFAYTVIGNEVEGGTDSALSILRKAKANVRLEPVEDEMIGQLAGLVESYEPKWEAELQTKCSLDDDGRIEDCPTEQWTGSLLIVRHPTTGIITTYYSDMVIPVNGMMNEAAKPNPFGVDGGLPRITDAVFKNEQIDFCVNVGGNKDKSDQRFDVRIVEGAHNASGIELVPDNNSLDGERNVCKK